MRFCVEPRCAIAANCGCLLARSVRSRGHAALGEHAGEDHRGTLHRAFQGRHHQAAECAAAHSHSLDACAHEHPPAMADVLVMRDVACSGYVTGNNTTWFSSGSGGYSLSAAATNMMTRLSFANDAGARYGSMLAFPAFDEQFRSGQLDTVMCAAATVSPFAAARSRACLLASQVHHHASAALGSDLGHRRHPQLLPGRRADVHAVLGHAQPAPSALWRRQHAARTLQPTSGDGACAHASLFARAVKAAENQDFISQGSTNNATCFLGPHRIYDPFTKSFMNLVPGQGHVRRSRCSRIRHRSAHRRRCACSAVWPRRDSGRCARRPTSPSDAHCLQRVPVLWQTRAGVGGRASRSRRLATRWCRWSWRSTRRWCTASAEADEREQQRRQDGASARARRGVTTTRRSGPESRCRASGCVCVKQEKRFTDATCLNCSASAAAPCAALAAGAAAAPPPPPPPPPPTTRRSA